MIFFKPEWIRLVFELFPPKLGALKINKQKIKKLEKLRCEYRIPHKLFALGISCTPAITKMVQYCIYSRIKELNPEASEKEVLREVLESRASLPEPFGYGYTEGAIDSIMLDINCVDDLVKFILSKEPNSVDLATFSEIGQEVDKILRE